jgi:drug/metabolite transporter (DMT)-like permease
MTLGFLLAVVAALVSATAAVLQSIGVQRIAATVHVDPRLLWRLARCGPYAAGLALNGAASVLTFAALRSVPLFAGQAISAANLGIIALLTTIVLGVRLRRREWAAIGGVVAGLLLLVIAARTAPPNPPTAAATWGLLGAVLGLSIAAYLAGPRMRNAVLPGLLAGLAFGAAATGARLLGGAGTAVAVLGSPATYALLLAGLAGTLLYATALQRGSVTTTSAMAVVGQTVAPAIAGCLLLGDGVRAGFAPVAAVGFVLAVAGAVSLGRHAHLGPARTA